MTSKQSAVEELKRKIMSMLWLDNPDNLDDQFSRNMHVLHLLIASQLSMCDCAICRERFAKDLAEQMPELLSKANEICRLKRQVLAGSIIPTLPCSLHPPKMREDEP